MKAVIDIENKNIKPMQEVIKEDGFNSANEFINHIIEEYIDAKKQLLPLGKEKIPNIDDLTLIETPDHANFSDDNKSRIPGKIGPPLQVPESSFDYNGYFTQIKLTASNLDKLVPENLPDIDPQKLSDMLSMLWGQINRLFAVKSALSITARSIIMKGSNGFINQQEFLDLVEGLSKDLTLLLNDIDSIVKTKLSVSFPKLNAEDYVSAKKSMSRFVNQYFWNIRRGNKQIDGALARLNFVKVYKDNAGFKIGITPEGLKFLQIQNPIHHMIELSDDNPSFEYQNQESLSDEEIAFLFKHIKKVIPNEHKAMIQVIKAVYEGNDNPAKLAQHLELEDIYGITLKMKETNRNGVLARLVEMRMIKKERVARTNVKYLVTDDAVELLKKEEQE